VNGGSAYFDGTGDYLDIADNAVLTPSGDFTIEFWAYPTSSTGIREWYSKGAGIQVYSSGTSWFVALSANNSGTYFINNTFGTLIPFAWQHIVVTRSGNSYVGFVNGIATTLATSSSAPNTGTNVLRIGDYSQSVIYPVIGYIANVRYVNGTAVYGTASFTNLPTTPLTAVTNTQLLLNFTNAGILDATGRNNLETVGNAQITTAVKKYGTGSLAFDGTGDYLLLPASQDLAMGTGDFTWECWIYATAASDQPIYECRSTSVNTNGFTVTAFSSTVIRVYTTAVLVTATVSNYLNTWTHIAFTRSGSTNRLFINGSLESTSTASDNFSNQVAAVGGGRYLNDNISKFFTGFIDDLRITKGIARYTANFTPPASAHRLK
jgi:hypothetical protein